MMSASKTLKKNLSIAVAAVFLAVAAFSCWAIEPFKAYADTTDSHLTVASEVHVLVDSEGNVTIPNATVTNDGTCAAYIMGCSSPDGLGWTCDVVGKRIEVGQSITATWRSAGPVSDEIAAQLGEEPYYAGNLTYTYTDGDLKGTVSLDNTDPTVGDTITATVTGANVPDDKLIYQWVKVKDGSETSIDGATGSTYTATDDDAGYELVCKVSSTDDICQGTICGATGAVKKIQAFAVYSADDDSLIFYKRAEVPKQGTIYLGKRATAVYTGLENMTSAPGWMLNYSKDIKTAIVYDKGISPTDTGFWFAELRNMKTVDVSKLDMSKCKSIGCMFTNCTSLEALDLSAWDTRSLTDIGQAFQNCTSLTKLNVSGWDVSKVTNMSLAFAEDRALTTLNLSGWDVSNLANATEMFGGCSKLTTIGDLSGWDVSNLASAQWMFFNCSRLSVNCSSWDVSKVTNHSNFNTNAPGVILPSAWQTSSDEGDKDSTIAPLCEEQGNGDALSVSDENGNDEATSKMDGKASADSETEGSNTASATDEAGAKEEEASGDIVQEEPAAA